jgi:large subunit ribosomal protein L3
MSVIIGKKLGMSRIFDEQGKNIPVTVIEAGPCFVTQIKTKQTDGYVAVQLGFLPKREKLVSKALLGHFKKANVPPMRVLKEFSNHNLIENIQVGAEIKVDLFAAGDMVVVTGISKGKGFAGVVKRHHFAGGPKTHGQSDRTRAPGSLGQSSDPSRVYKGLRMAGRMGDDQVTIKNAKVVKVDAEKNLLIIRGSIPGANNGIVFIRKQ